MAFITLGTTDDLQIQIPTKRTTAWADTLKNEFFIKVVEHDHTGGGRGRQLGGASLADNTITAAKIRLLNDEFLRATDSAGTGDVSLIKANSSDQIEFGADIASANVLNLTSPSTNVDTSTVDKILTDNSVSIDSATTSTIVSIDTTKSQTIDYRIEFESSSQTGTLVVSGTDVQDEFVGTDHGFPFSLSGSDVQLDTSSSGTIAGGNQAVVTFLLKEI